MNTLLKTGTVFALCGLAACAHQPMERRSPPQPVTLSWTAVTTNEIGTSVSEGITYNIYAVPGAGPIPTESSHTCGAVMVAKGAPLNSEPIVATTYYVSLEPGLWTFAVEAVAANGCRSALSSPATITVPTRGHSSTTVTVAP